jgi:antitoxin HicB
MKTLNYKVLFRKEEDETYTVIVPSLPGCLTFGRTIEEARAMAKEAIEGFIACMIERSDEVPVESEDSHSDRDFNALPEYEESTAKEIHALIENEKDDFITFEEYAKRCNIKL